MSKAFTSNADDGEFIADIGDLPVSTARNLVTADGIEQMESNINLYRREFAEAEKKEDRIAMATATRNLRYWETRRENAELSVPAADETVVRFGMFVDLRSEDGKPVTWKIVGEDEADPSQGKISHVSPMAQALFGQSVGDVALLNDKEWEIVRMKVPKDG